MQLAMTIKFASLGSPWKSVLIDTKSAFVCVIIWRSYEAIKIFPYIAIGHLAAVDVFVVNPKKPVRVQHYVELV